MEKTLSYIALVLLFLLGALGGWWLRGVRTKPVQPVTQTDTLWLHDTVRFPVPVPKTKWIHDTAYVAVTDTAFIHSHDTTYVPVPRETTYYADSLYELWLTGFRTSLDSIHVFKSVAIVKEPVYVTVKKPWGIGVQTGATYLPNQGITPYVGIGISYNLLTFKTR